MYKKLFSLLLSCLCLSTVGSGFALSQAGVSPGVTFYYEVSDFGGPDQLINKTEYMKVTITSINNSRVLTQNLLHFNDDTESSLTMEYDVDSGSTHFVEGSLEEGRLFLYVIFAANLNPNSRIYPSSSKNPWVVNGTVMKSYSGVERETNFFDYTHVTGDYHVYQSFYFDKTTGALVEYYEEWASSDSINGYSINLTQSSAWVVPEFPSFILLPILMIAVAGGALIFKKRQLKFLKE